MRKLMSMALAASLALTGSPAVAQSPPGNTLSLEQRSTMRCAAAFALVADGQKRGEAQALQYPALAERGKEFFVRSAARLMDQTGMDRSQIAGILEREARDLQGKDEAQQIMPSCLVLLAASGI